MSAIFKTNFPHYKDREAWFEYCKLIFVLSNIIHEEKSNVPELDLSSDGCETYVDLIDMAGDSFYIEELFDITGTATTKIDDLIEYGAGDYPYVTTSSENNSTAGWYNHRIDLKAIDAYMKSLPYASALEALA